MPELKLYYFNARARAEVSRLVLAAANVSYEFVQVDRSRWPELKPTFPFGQLPVLEVDGKRFGQSLAIQSYLAKEHGLHGSNNIEELEINQIMQLREDLMKETQNRRDRDPAKQAEREKHLTEDVYPRYLGYFTNILKENGNGYTVGEKLSLADLVIFEATSAISHSNAALIQQHPEIVALREKVAQVPGIKEYLANRVEATHM